MLKIRLQRVGRKHDPSYRIVVVEHTTGPKSGKHIEIIGNYNAKTNTKVVNADKVKEWMSKGAKVSDTLHNILVSEKILEGKKINVLSKKSPIIDEEKIKAEKEAKEKAEQEAKAKAEAEKAAAETPAEEIKEDAPETPAEEAKEEALETPQDTPAETKEEEEKKEA